MPEPHVPPELGWASPFLPQTWPGPVSTSPGPGKVERMKLEQRQGQLTASLTDRHTSVGEERSGRARGAFTGHEAH